MHTRTSVKWDVLESQRQEGTTAAIHCKCPTYISEIPFRASTRGKEEKDRRSASIQSRPGCKWYLRAGRSPAPSKSNVRRSARRPAGTLYRLTRPRYPSDVHRCPSPSSGKTSQSCDRHHLPGTAAYFGRGPKLVLE